MRITYIAAGAGAMYCGACARDLSLVRCLVRLGHDVDIVPLYTPLRTEDEALASKEVYFGGINVQLQQMSGVFRRLPRALDRFLDSPRLLRWVSKFSVEVDPRRLGPMTVSVLAGRDGLQRKELDRLLDHLAGGERIDIVNLTNALLSGLAPEIRRRLGCRVACTFQGEDNFIAELPEPYRSQARDLLRHNARDVDVFIAPSESAADSMAALLGLERSKIKVIPTGLDPRFLPPETSGEPADFTVGYLSAIRPAKGLDLLVDALRILTGELGRDLRLLVAGQVLDSVYWKTVRSRVETLGLSDRFEYLGELTPAEKSAFFGRCSIFSVPSRQAEARGVAVMEAMAAGLAVVVPDHGAYAEVVARTGGGVLFPVGDARALAQRIAQLMDNPPLRRQVAAAAHAGIREHYGDEAMARATIAAYASVPA